MHLGELDLQAIYPRLSFTRQESASSQQEGPISYIQSDQKIGETL